jgi:hypothetical protein
MLHGRSDLLAGRDIPHAQGVVVGPGQDAPLVLRQSGAKDGVVVTPR